jgi:hypothetical protein
MTSIVTARKMLTSWGVVAVPAMAALLLSVCAAAAQEAPKPVVDPAASQDEIKQFCTNIADPARDQRYLLQKQELEKLQADVRLGRHLQEHEAGCCCGEPGPGQDHGGSRDHHEALATPVEPRSGGDGSAKGGRRHQYHR